MTVGQQGQVNDVERERCRADQLNYAFAHISQFQELIRFADTKAGAAVTIVSGLLAVLVGAIGSASLTLSVPLTSAVTSARFWLTVLALVLMACFFVTFLGVLYYAFLTFLPRLEKREYTPTVAFFHDVYKTGEEEFIERVSTMSTDDLLEHLLREVFLLSEILVHKFTAQRLCFNWLRFVIVFWAAAQITILFIPQL